mmetsp:Transcript_50940/g.101298  ORF Transcript_50940/g.101298 Transcript_50940/m.101298 type:complete len:306 (+) Transcript_50940:45-962(+)
MLRHVQQCVSRLCGPVNDGVGRSCPLDRQTASGTRLCTSKASNSLRLDNPRLTARVAWECLVLVEESLVGQRCRAFGVPSLEGSADQGTLDLRPIPGAAVVVARIEEDAVLGLGQQVSNDERRQVLAKAVLRGGGVRTRVGFAHHIASLPRIVLALHREGRSFNVLRGVLGKDALPALLAWIRSDARRVEARSGRLLEGVHVLHVAVVLGAALLVEEETAIWHTRDLSSGPCRLCGSRVNFSGPVVTVQKGGKTARAAAGDNDVGRCTHAGVLEQGSDLGVEDCAASEVKGGARDVGWGCLVTTD